MWSVRLFYAKSEESFCYNWSIRKMGRKGGPNYGARIY